MTDQEYLNLALASIHTGQWFGWKKDWTGSHRMSYENIIIYSDITKISDIDIALKYIDLYQTKSEGLKSVVNYRVFVTSKDFHLENSKMIEASSLL